MSSWPNPSSWGTSVNGTSEGYELRSRCISSPPERKGSDLRISSRVIFACAIVFILCRFEGGALSSDAGPDFCQSVHPYVIALGAVADDLPITCPRQSDKGEKIIVRADPLSPLSA